MDEVSLLIEGPIARIRLERPERRNAMTRAMWRALPDLCWRIEASGETLVVIVEGSGGDFCAGADISEFETVYRNAESTNEYSEAIQNALNALRALERPTIAALRGAVVGGGLALGLACDLRFCARDAFLAITPAKLGLLYGFAETRRLASLVGPARARDILYSARRIDGAEALAIGLVDRLVDPERLDETVLAYALELSQLSQHSIRGAKIAIDAIEGGLASESEGFRALVEGAAAGADFSEGRRAFLDKRAPAFVFRGRLDHLD